MTEQSSNEPVSATGSDYYNPAYEKLSAGQTIPGAIAYALYKQAKREWVTEFRTLNNRRPTDDEMRAYAATQTESVWLAFRANADRVLAAYADNIIRDVKPGIVIEATRGGFWRSFWPSLVASIAFAGLLLLIVAVAAIFGFGLPVQLNFPKA